MGHSWPGVLLRTHLHLGDMRGRVYHGRPSPFPFMRKDLLSKHKATLGRGERG